VLNFIYYPVSFILWVWHEVFSFVLGDTGWAGGIAWTLSVMFLVFTLRALLFKPFVSQMRSMRRMQAFQPEIAKIRKKYANDRQKQAEEMQKLQREHGVNPVAGCLPMIVQIPVFIGLFQVLRTFGPLNDDGSVRTENYFFDKAGVDSFNSASLFGAKLGNWVLQGEQVLNQYGTSIVQMLIVMIPLMIAAGVFTHITARHSVSRQTAAQAENPQTAIMNKVMLYLFPIGVVVGAPFLPLAVLIYWVSNNLWTLGQQYIVYKRIDAEESEKREQKAAVQQARAPRPGQKPVRPESGVPMRKAEADSAESEGAEVDAAAAEQPVKTKTPGAKPVTRKSNGTAGAASGNGSKPKPGAKPTTNGAARSSNGSAGDSARGARSGSGARPPARRPRKRR
jgi:YidC/Oxa1 family membrane protein insertase